MSSEQDQSENKAIYSALSQQYEIENPTQFWAPQTKEDQRESVLSSICTEFKEEMAKEIKVIKGKSEQKKISEDQVELAFLEAQEKVLCQSGKTWLEKGSLGEGFKKEPRRVHTLTERQSAAGYGETVKGDSIQKTHNPQPSQSSHPQSQTAGASSGNSTASKESDCSNEGRAKASLSSQRQSSGSRSGDGGRTKEDEEDDGYNTDSRGSESESHSDEGSDEDEDDDDEFWG